jgi:Protein of unknown function (DUF2905)
MLKWFIIVVVAVVLLGFLAPQLNKFGLGKLPGDLRFRYRGRDVYLPITTTVLISAVLMLIARFI